MIDEAALLAYREQSFMAFCAERGLTPTDDLRAAHKAGASCCAEYLKLTMGPVIALAQRSGSVAPRREERSALNLWGLLP